jgi:LDH2 family malate/lactate/ureidoglycolate dehydrogenase
MATATMARGEIMLHERDGKLLPDTLDAAVDTDGECDGREQRAESREQRAESREQRAESREQRAESRE